MDGLAVGAGVTGVVSEERYHWPRTRRGAVPGAGFGVNSVYFGASAGVFAHMDHRTSARTGSSGLRTSTTLDVYERGVPVATNIDGILFLELLLDFDAGHAFVLNAFLHQNATR